MRISIVEANFSHNLGTLPKMVGETSLRFWGSVSGLSTKVDRAPRPDGLEKGDDVFIDMGQRKVGDHLIRFIGRMRLDQRIR